MRAHYESNGLFMFRTNGMSRSHGCERVTILINLYSHFINDQQRII
jgi:hypothetical protein